MLIVDFLIFISKILHSKKKNVCASVRHQSQGWRENPLFDYDLNRSSENEESIIIKGLISKGLRNITKLQDQTNILTVLQQQ